MMNSVLGGIALSLVAWCPAGLAAGDGDADRAYEAELLGQAAQESNPAEGLSSNPGKLKFIGFTQLRYQYNHRDSTPDGSSLDTEGFEIPRTRLQLDGMPQEWLGYRLRATFNKSGDIGLDHAFATAHLPDGWKLRFGQFALNLFRDDMVAAQRQLAVNASTVNALFNADKTQGVEIGRQWEKFRFWSSFNDGLRSGNTPYNSPDEADWAFSSRAEWQLAGTDWSRFDDYTSFPGSSFASMLGVGGEIESGSQVEEGGDDFGLAYLTGDLGLEGDGWNAFASAVMVYNDINMDDAGIDWGFIVQGGFFLTEQLEAFARFDMILGNETRDRAEGNFRTITAGANYYIIPNSHAFKITCNGLWFLDPQTYSLLGTETSLDLLPSDDDGQWGIQLQVQVMF